MKGLMKISLIKIYPNKTALFKKLFFHFLFITLFVVGIYALDNTAFFKKIKEAAFYYIMF
jgi:hypothetical protein